VGFFEGEKVDCDVGFKVDFDCFGLNDGLKVVGLIVGDINGDSMREILESSVFDLVGSKSIV